MSYVGLNYCLFLFWIIQLCNLNVLSLTCSAADVYNICTTITRQSITSCGRFPRRRFPQQLVCNTLSKTSIVAGHIALRALPEWPHIMAPNRCRRLSWIPSCRSACWKHSGKHTGSPLFSMSSKTAEWKTYKQFLGFPLPIFYYQHTHHITY